ncbi:MAG: hypothetical protein CMB53_02110 [Euryarchaeota archaeon]|nr:hypothetical protein [Euryarchaeota archaeon]
MGSHIEALREIVGSRSKEITTLFLENSVREIDIGVHEHEIGSPQRISFDLYVIIEGASKPKEDQIDMVLDYEFLSSSIDRVASRKRSALMETLASELLDEIMSPGEIVAATVSLKKLDVVGIDGELGCSMTRIR